jgi:chemotaxis protein CheX
LLSINEATSELLECTIESVHQIMQISINLEASYLSNETELQTEMCVLVDFTGEVSGRMIIKGQKESFGRLGLKMFGMTLEGDMLDSFVGEIANMVAGNISTLISQRGRKVDITPPTMIEGGMKLFHFEKVLFIPLSTEDVGEMDLILLLQEEKAA